MVTFSTLFISPSGSSSSPFLPLSLLPSFPSVVSGRGLKHSFLAYRDSNHQELLAPHILGGKYITPLSAVIT